MPRNRYQLCHVGAGHARHVLDVGDGHVLCGASRRPDRSGVLPLINSHRPYDAAKVDCRRCRRALGIGEGSGQ